MELRSNGWQDSGFWLTVRHYFNQKIFLRRDASYFSVEQTIKNGASIDEGSRCRNVSAEIRSGGECIFLGVVLEMKFVDENQSRWKNFL